MASIKNKWLLCLALLPLLTGGGALAADDTAGQQELLQALKDSQVRRQELVGQTKQLGSSFIQATQEIQHLKSQNLGLIGQYKLNTKLSQAKSLSQQLEQMQSELTRLENQIQLQRQRLLLVLDRQIKLSGGKILDRRTSSGSARKEARKLQQMLALRRLVAQERMMVENAEQVYLPSLDPSADDRKSLEGKVNYLKSREALLQKKLALTSTQAKDLKARWRLTREVRHFVEEESFFAENSYTTVNPVGSRDKKDNSSGGNLLAKDGTEAPSLAGTAGNPTQGAPPPPSDTVTDLTQENQANSPGHQTLPPQMGAAEAAGDIPSTALGRTDNDSDFTTDDLLDANTQFDNLLNRAEGTLFTSPTAQTEKRAAAGPVDYPTAISRLTDERKALERQLLLLRSKMLPLENELKTLSRSTPGEEAH